MCGLFPWIPILGSLFFTFSIKKGITGWGVQVLLWNLSWIAAFNTTNRDCNGIRTHNHLLCKWTLNHLAKLYKWLSCVVSTYLYGVRRAWHDRRTWHDNNIQSVHNRDLNEYIIPNRSFDESFNYHKQSLKITRS